MTETSCSALEQSATKYHRCYFSHIVQETYRQLYKMGIKDFAYSAHHRQTQTQLNHYFTVLSGSARGELIGQVR